MPVKLICLSVASLIVASASAFAIDAKCPVPTPAFCSIKALSCPDNTAQPCTVVSNPSDSDCTTAGASLAFYPVEYGADKNTLLVSWDNPQQACVGTHFVMHQDNCEDWSPPSTGSPVDIMEQNVLTGSSSYCLYAGGYSFNPLASRPTSKHS